MRKVFCAIALGAVLVGCGNPDSERATQLQSEVDSLRAEVNKFQSEAESLKKALDTEKNGPERLLARAGNELASGDRASAKKTYAELVSHFPESSQARIAKSSISDIDAQLAMEEKARLAEENKKVEQQRQAMARLDTSLNKRTDEFNGITWITHKSEPILGKYISIYFGTKDGKVGVYPLRLKIHYYADDWLFIKGVTIKADDQTYELSGLDFERDNSSGSIWEWSDTPVTDKGMLAKIADSNRAVIRFEGRQYHSDFVVPDAQKKAMREMLLAWERYGGKP